MNTLKKTTLVIAAAGCTTGLAVLAANADRSPHAHSAVAKGFDVTRAQMSDAPVMACFSPDSPLPERYAAAIEAMFIEAQLRYNEAASWTPTGQGINLRWSLVPDGLSIPSGIGEPTAPSQLFSNLDSRFGGNRALWLQQFDRSFQRWADISGLSYTFVTSGGNDWDDGAFWGASGSSTRGDVRIAMKPIDGGGGVLAYNSFPTNSDMVLDSAENWGSSSSSFRFLRNILMHEHGHGLGAAHICPAAGFSLMEPFLNTSFDGPQHDDFRFSQRGYGDPNEPDNSIAAATDLGTIASGASVNLGVVAPQPVSAPQPAFTTSLSIDSNGESDFFRFAVSTPSIVDISIDPVGRSYDNSDQFGSGACGSGNIIDSEEIADLAFQVLDAGGSVIATADSAGLGFTESITGLLLPASGAYFLRVYETNNFSESQLYQGSIAVLGAAECANNNDCNDGDPCTIDVCDNGQCLNFANNDCNNNGREDSCEIAQGDAQDCNMNGIPDECEIAPLPFAETSPQLSPIGSGSNQSYTFVSVPDAGDTVTLTFDTLGDINSGAETMEVFLNGVSIGLIYEETSGYFDCTQVGVDTLTVAASTWNASAGGNGGDVVIEIVPNAFINPDLCLPGNASYVQVNASYDTNASAADVNGNGIPDECEGPLGCSPADITATGSCNPGTGDGLIDLSDFSCYLSLWSSSAPEADITLEGVCDALAGGGDGVTLSDFSCFLALWSNGCP